MAMAVPVVVPPPDLEVPMFPAIRCRPCADSGSRQLNQSREAVQVEIDRPSETDRPYWSQQRSHVNKTEPVFLTIIHLDPSVEIDSSSIDEY